MYYNTPKKKDTRIKVIHKKNAGLGMARNTGLDNATGKYICFIDSDDYIALDTVEKCYLSAKKYGSDTVIFGMYSISADGKIIAADIPNTEKEYYCDEEIPNFIVPNMIATDPKTGKKSGLNMSACGRMYLRNMIENYHWRFVSEREFISEDFYSLLILYHYVKKVSVIKDAYYYYCYNDTSLTHSFREERWKKVCYCHAGMIDVYRSCEYPKEVKICLDSQFIGSMLATMKLIVTSNITYIEKIKQIRNILNDQYLCTILNNMDIRNETKARKLIIAATKCKLYSLIYWMIKIKC